MKTFGLGELLHREFAGEDREWLAIVMPGMDDAAIESWIADLVKERLSSELATGLFASGSVGAVFGLALSGGERVVLKVFHPTQVTSELRASERCHAIAVER